MIVTCEKCQTSFRLDDDRVKETGSKVRCSRCKHTFKVFRAPAEPTEQEPVSPGGEDYTPAESLAVQEEPQEDFVAEEQETSPDLGGDEENLDFGFLEKQGEAEAPPSEESLDFDMGDLELGIDAGTEPPSSEEVPVPEEGVEEESPDFGLEGFEEEDISEEVSTEEPVGSVGIGHQVAEETLVMSLDDFRMGGEEESASEQEVPVPEEGVEEESPDFGLEGFEEEGVSEEVSTEEPVGSVGIGDQVAEETLIMSLDDFRMGGEEEPASEQEVPVSEEGVEEESPDFGLEGLEEEVPLAEEPDVSGRGEELSEESLGVELEGLEMDEEKSSSPEPLNLESAPAEEAGGDFGVDLETLGEEEAPTENSAPEEAGVADEPFELTLEEEPSGISYQGGQGAIDEGKDSEFSGIEMATDEEQIESPSGKKDNELSPIGEEDFTLGDISADDAGADEIDSPPQFEDEKKMGSSGMTEMEEIPFDEGPGEDDEDLSFEDEAPLRAYKIKRRPSLFLIILLVIVSIGGGVYAAITFLNFKPFQSGFKVPYLDIVIGGEKSEPVEHDPGNLKIALLDVKGYFEENKEAGPLFVIKGNIRNDYSKDRSFVRAKGILYNEAGNIVNSKIVYCGNVLTKTELEDLHVADINKKLSVKSGVNQVNVKIPPNKMVPFMVVFEKLPAELGEFSVEVEGSVAG